MGTFVGVEKVAAGRLGLTLEQYQAQVQKGLKWCFKCKAWKPIANFGKDISRGDGKKAKCKACEYQKKVKLLSPETKAVQAAASNAVRTAVRGGDLPKVTSLFCKCGEPAKHYHHSKGYETEHWLEVEPLCRSCHKLEHWEN